jgi:predicted nucleic acid-binding protein
MEIDPVKKIVLDTCIILYCIDENTKESCGSIIKKFKDNGNRVCCSALSGFEVLKNRQESDNQKEYVDFINQLPRIPVDTPTLANASTLYFLYKQTNRIQEKSDFYDRKDKLTGDLIIGGATLSHENHFLLTSNKKDFPTEYWEVVSEFNLITKDGNLIKVYLLNPDMKKIISRLPKNSLQNVENWPTKINLYDYRG